MSRNLGRVFWWLVAYERPGWAGDYAAIGALVGMGLLGALAISWPWVSVEVPRAIGTGLAVVQAALGAWVRQLASLVEGSG